MEKKFYNSPDAKFIKLRSRAAFLAYSSGEDPENGEVGAKGCSSISFDEDED